MPVETITEAKRGVIALLQAGVRARLDRYDAKLSDGVTTPSPEVYYEAEKEIHEEYPSVEVFPTAGSPQVESYAHVLRHRLVVGFRFAGDDEQQLQRQSEAMMWAVRHVVRDASVDDAEDGELGPLDTGNEEYAMLPRPAGMEVPFVKGGYIEVFLTTVEEA